MAPARLRDMPQLSMPKPEPTHWQWRILDQDKRGRPKWRTLRWRMREDEALAWAANNQKQIEKVPGSGEVRRPGEIRTSGGVMKTPGFGD